MTNGHAHDDDHAQGDAQAAAVARLEEQILDLTRAIERDPDDADAYSRRGVAYGQMAAPMEALRDFNHVVRLRPDSAEAHYNRGMAHTSLHQPLQAIDDYTKCLELDPGHRDACNNRAASYIELRRADEALPDLERALAIDANSATAYALRSMAHALLGNDAQCDADSRWAVSLGFDGHALEYLVLRAKQQRAPERGL